MPPAPTSTAGASPIRSSGSRTGIGHPPARATSAANADLLAADRPNVASAAGVNVVEVNIATATARIAPVAIDFSAGVLIT